MADLRLGSVEVYNGRERKSYVYPFASEEMKNYDYYYVS